MNLPFATMGTSLQTRQMLRRARIDAAMGGGAVKA